MIRWLKKAPLENTLILALVSSSLDKNEHYE